MQELHQTGYYKLRKLLKKVPFNCHFANSVVENHVKGKIFIDDPHYPDNAYILHPYGMSLLAGDAKNSEFENWLFPYLLDGNRQRCQDEWMQVYPDIWNEKIVANLPLKIFDPENSTNVPFQESVAMYRRVNFQFNSKNIPEF